MSVTRWISTASYAGFAAALNFLSPPECGWCESPLAAGPELRPQLCDPCREALAPRLENPCPRCAAPRGPFLADLNACLYCQADRFAFEGVVALGVYADRLRAACLRAKTGLGTATASALGAFLVDRAGATLRAWTIDAVVPVPLHWSNTLWGGNAAPAVLSESIAARLGRPLRLDLLSKRRHTPAQGRLSPTERRENLRGAFLASPRCRGLSLLLVDDVLTTGATAHRCARALLSAGARVVHVAVAARGLGKPRVAPVEPGATALVSATTNV